MYQGQTRFLHPLTLCMLGQALISQESCSLKLTPPRPCSRTLQLLASLHVEAIGASKGRTPASCDDPLRCWSMQTYRRHLFSSLRYDTDRGSTVGSKCRQLLAVIEWDLKDGHALPMQARRGVKQANEVRAGNVIDLDGRLCEILKLVHTQGHDRQIGNVQMELRDLQAQTKLYERRRPSDMVELVRLEGRQYQYLYSTSEGGLHLMDPQTFEQEEIAAAAFGSTAAFLMPDITVTVNFAPDGKAVLGELPQTLQLKVVEAEPYAKGNSATSSYKQCTVESGARVAVPPCVQAGDSIVVDTASGTFVKRVNKQ